MSVAGRRDLEELEYLLNHPPQRIAEGTVVYSDPRAFCKVYLAFEFLTLFFVVLEDKTQAEAEPNFSTLHVNATRDVARQHSVVSSDCDISNISE